MNPLKKSTSVTVLIGPVLDSSGVAITGAVVGDFNITKNGSTTALAYPATATHSHNGHYLIGLSTANVDTVGLLALSVNNSAQAMPIHRFTVLLESVYDAIVTNAVNTTGGFPSATGAISALAGAISTYNGGAVASVTDGVTLAPNQDVRNVLGTVAGSVASVVAGVALATSQPNYAPSKAGDAMTLTSEERTAVANEVEAQIIDDTDSEKVLQAIVDKIAAANPSLEDLTLAAIASAVRTELSTELALIDAAITSRASQSSVNTIDDLIDTEIATIITNQGTILGNQTTIINKTNLLTTFPTNFSSLSINSSGHIGRVALVDVTTTNTDMRGTDNAITAAELNARTILAANYATASALAEVAEDTSLLIPDLISEINPPTAAEIADKYLGRNIAGGSDGGRTVSSTYRVLRNKVEINELTNTITVYAEDDTTVAWTGSVTPAASTNHGYKAIDPG